MAPPILISNYQIQIAYKTMQLSHNSLQKIYLSKREDWRPDHISGGLVHHLAGGQSAAFQTLLRSNLNPPPLLSIERARMPRTSSSTCRLEFPIPMSNTFEVGRSLLEPPTYTEFFWLLLVPVFHEFMNSNRSSLPCDVQLDLRVPQHSNTTLSQQSL